MIKKLYTKGLRESDNTLIRLRVILTNLIFLFTFPLFLFYLPLFFKHGQNGSVIAFSIAIIGLLFSYWLNSKRHFRYSSYLILITTNLILAYTLITYGKVGESQCLFPVLMIFIFIFFDNLVEWTIFCLLNLSSVFVSFLYLDIAKPELLVRLVSYDYYTNFGFALFSCGVLSFLVTRSITNHITSQAQSISELEAKTNLIQKHNEEMEIFTTMASHDLKTPLRTIKGFLGLLAKEGKIEDSKSLGYLNLAISGTDQLNNLVDGISAFKNLENEILSDSFSDTNKILNQVITSIGINENPNIEVERSSLPDLQVSPTHLHHVFQNLIENAIKYNENSIIKIKISSVLEEDDLIIKFTDNGIGIEQDYLEYIFEPFKKLHPTEKYQGAGLGLPICKKILALYEGTIKAECYANGTTMTIHLPISLVKVSSF